MKTDPNIYGPWFLVKKSMGKGGVKGKVNGGNARNSTNDHVMHDEAGESRFSFENVEVNEE